MITANSEQLRMSPLLKVAAETPWAWPTGPVVSGLTSAENVKDAPARRAAVWCRTHGFVYSPNLLKCPAIIVVMNSSDSKEHKMDCRQGSE